MTETFDSLAKAQAAQMLSALSKLDFEALREPSSRGRYLRRLRLEAGVPIAVAAARIGRGIASFHRIEEGRGRQFAVVHVAALSALYADALKTGGKR